MEPVIVGAGGHGQDIAYETGWRLVDHDPERGCPVPDTPGTYVAGAFDPLVRAAIAQRMDEAGWTAYRRGVWIHPSAVLGPAVKLGDHVHVGPGATLTRCTIGDYTTVANQATISGDVTIGARCLIGANATVRNLMHLTDDVTIGCGAVVAYPLTLAGTYTGVPARLLR